MIDKSTPLPAVRRIRIYAFDPQASVELETAVVNDATIALPWEAPWEDPLTVGPRNDYLDIIDYDPACDLFYEPLDLNDPLLLAQDGLPPSETRPQFHQQMVFAVAMRTIRMFERALGRPIFWTREAAQDEANARSPSKEASDNAAPVQEIKPDRYPDLIKRLRIYPHALREPNAYYSPAKTALLFGYFKPGGDVVDQDRGWIFTCLSQDIIAHETTHAILHGMRRRSVEPTNPDSLAFHEAFADIVALFQHFTMREVVAHQIAFSRGSLRSNGLLMGLAAQFGHATGRNGPLRLALRMVENEMAAAESTSPAAPGGGATPDGRTYANSTEPHDRGSFLVAAVFDAFVAIYERRTADLLRLATGGSRPDGRELPPDLVNRLAKEASKAADHVLRMCVRALDYLPPTDATFGDYLRAIITADTELVPDDPLRYRVAIAEAFRRRGIYADGCLSMAPDSLMLEPPDLGPELGKEAKQVGLFTSLLPELQLSALVQTGPARDRITDVKYSAPGPEKRYPNLRESSIRMIDHNQKAVWSWFIQASPQDKEWEELLGLQFLDSSAFESILRSDTLLEEKGARLPAVEVHSVRIAQRAGPDGQELHQLIMQLTQRRSAYYEPAEQAAADAGTLETSERERERGDKQDFWFRGGATLLVDIRDGRLCQVIRKAINDDKRLQRQREFLKARRGPVADDETGVESEPFAFLHGGMTL